MKSLQAISRMAFRAVLVLFPRAFVKVHGEEMAEAFRAEVYRTHRERGTWAAVRYSIRAVGDAGRQGLKQRLWGKRCVVPAPSNSANISGRNPFAGLSIDIRLALRSLGRSKGFAAAAVLVLALGIGANTTLFSALETAILTPPPFPETDRLVIPDLVRERDGQEVGMAPWWPYPSFELFRDTENRLVDPIAAYGSTRVTLTGNGPATVTSAEVVSPDYFRVLGAPATLGRTFLPSEGVVEHSLRVAVISYGFWLSRFGGSDSVLGREVVVDGKGYEVVGVAPRWFSGLKGNATLWLPIGATVSAQSLRRVHDHGWYVVGRLRPGARLDAARAQMQAIGGAIDAAYPFSTPGLHYVGELKSFQDAWTNDDARQSVLMLSAAGVLVLLVACANLSGLLLARHTRRAREHAVRLAVGASRWHLIRSSLTEGLVLSCLAGIAGAGLARWGTRVLRSNWPERFLYSVREELRVVNVDGFSVDTTVLVGAVGFTLVTAVLVGVLPALRISKADLTKNLKDSPGMTRPGTRLFSFDVGESMIAAQTAIAILLLIGAGLVGASVRRLFDVELGFRADRLLTFEYRMPTSEHTADPATALDHAADFTEELLQRVRALPGVEGATSGCIPLRGVCNAFALTATELVPEMPREDWRRIAVSSADASYFDVLGIPVVAGRRLDERDRRDDRITVVLSEAAADLLFPGEDPVGRWIELNANRRAHVVGVSRVVLREPPDEQQLPEAIGLFRDLPGGRRGVMVRTAGNPLAMVPLIRNELRILDPRVPLVNVATMDDRLNRAIGDRRLILSLLTSFAVVSVLLVAIATWAIVARAVADRTRELGVRIALGAHANVVLPLVLGRSLLAAVLGIVVGAGAAWASTRVLGSFLYDTSARDPVAFLAGSILLLGVVALASYLPATRAMTINPVDALRAE